MQFINPRTVFFITIIVFVTCALLMIMLWRNSRKRFSGMGWLVGDYACQTAALVLIIGRDMIPDWASVVLSNTFIMFGALLGFMGLERFTGKKGTQIHNFILLAVFAVTHIVFLYHYPSLMARNINISIFLFIICFQCAWLLLRSVGPELRPVTRATGIVFACYCFTSLVRIPVDVFQEHIAQELFRMAAWDMTVIIGYMTLFIVLTYAITLMLNRRLILDIRFQEEKFSKIFHSSPNAILLTRLSDGTVYEVNDGFQELTGFTAEEVMGKTTIDLRLWGNAADRALVVEAVTRGGSVQGMELNFRKKTGEMLTGILSADIITIDKLTIMIATISDITVQKKTEENVRTLLAEKELILREVHHRIKNNMLVIKGILEIQSSRLASHEAVDALMDSARRVQSMMVLYDALYRADGSGSASIDTYLPSLVNQIAELFPARESIEIRTECDAVVMDGGVLSTIGIIITEFITNSMKYAFAGHDSGRITISFTRSDGSAVIAYSDDGVGLPGTFDTEGAPGFGMQLISLLVKQLRGRMTVERPGGSGIGFIIEFPL